MAGARLLALLAVLLAGLAALPGVARAQVDELAGSFVTPFPENDTYKMLVIGDWLAGGMIEGLVEGFSTDTRVQIARKHYPVLTLFRGEFEEDVRALDASLAKDKVHIAVVLLGTADRVSVRLPNSQRRALVGSPEWRAEYARRVDRLVRVLKARNIAVYWVGLPIQRRGEANDDAQTMNEIYRERVLLNGLRFIDVYKGFADESGEFAAYGPDLTGKSKRLRDPDGLGFTGSGYRKLAHFVESEVKRDLTQARTERSIPLAGAEGEQARVNPDKAAAAAAAQAAAVTAKAQRSGGPMSGLASLLPGATQTAPGGSAEQRADNGKITLKSQVAGGREETVTLDILRPAIPAAVLAIVARRQEAEKSGPIGENLMTPVSGGLTLLSTISPTSDKGSAARRRSSPTQAPYFRVLVKGEPQPPKPGRADDFRWPREAVVPQRAAAVPAAIETGTTPPPRAVERPVPRRPRE